MSSLRGSHWISEDDEDEYTVTIDLISDLVLDETTYPRGAITYHRDDSPTCYITQPWNDFMEAYLRYG